MKPLHLNFVLSRDGYIRKDGKALIHLMIAYNGNRKPLSTGIHLSPKEWDKKKQRVTAKCSQQVNYNMLLDNMKQRARDFHIRESQKFAFFSVQNIADYIQGKSDSDFIEFCENHIQERKEKDAVSTIKQKLVVLQYLKKYGESIPFQHIDYSFVNRFESFLLRQPHSRKPGETIGKNYVVTLLKYLKGMTTAAQVQEIISIDPFLGIKLVLSKSDKIGLTLIEIEKIYNLKEGRGKRPISKDAFVFSCYTGLRFSDMFESHKDPLSGLRAKHIVNDGQGLRIYKKPYKTRKTGENIDVPLYIMDDFLKGRTVEILSRYLPGKTGDDLIFETVHNKTYNDAVRTFAKKAGINKEITGHAGRISFITNCAKYGANIEGIRGLVGHASQETTQRYMKIKNFDSFFKK